MKAKIEFTDTELELIKDALSDTANNLRAVSYAAAIRDEAHLLRERGERMARLSRQIRFAVTQDEGGMAGMNCVRAAPQTQAAECVDRRVDKFPG
jgi:hypothetical protein